MIQARILIDYKSSKGNKDLLEFLHNNINSIKKKINIKVIIVYNDLIPKLPKNVKRLPVMITTGLSTVGVKNIKQKIINSIGTTDVKSKDHVKDMGVSDLQDFWDSEMHNGKDNDNNDDNVMESVKNKAMEVSIQRQESTPKQKKKLEPIVSNNREENIQLEQIQSEKISDMVDDDPMMKKFWDNQEATPGFN
jgi:vacuolar-type H+-ATPase subunit F/Vma7